MGSSGDAPRDAGVRYVHPLSERYASREMQEIFSPARRYGTWRRLWLALAEAQKELGLQIPDAALEAIRANLDTVDLARAMLDAGWEFVGHGVHQRALNTLADPGAAITESLVRLQAFTGRRPRGWLGPGLRESADTPELLSAAGVEYVCDWTIDDVPVWMHTSNGPLIAMPYSLELNDSVMHAVENHPSSVLLDRVTETLETFDRELEEDPRVLTIPLHPHLIGVPHRIGYLARALDLLLARDDCRFVTGSELADWFKAAQPPPT